MANSKRKQVLFRHLLEYDTRNQKQPILLDETKYKPDIESITGTIGNQEFELVMAFVRKEKNAIKLLKDKYDYTNDDLMKLDFLRELYKGDKEEIELKLNLRLVACIYEMSDDEIMSIGFKGLNQLTKPLNWFFKPVKEQETKLSFKFKNKTYHLPANIHDPEFGRFHDFENYFIRNPSLGWHRCLKLISCFAATKPHVVWRDKKGRLKRKRGTYYNEIKAKQYFEEFKDLDIGAVQSYLSFFLRQGKHLEKISRMHSVAEEVTSPTLLNLLKVGDGLAYFIHSHRPRWRLSQYLVYKLLKLYHGLITKTIIKRLTRQKKERQKLLTSIENEENDTKQNIRNP